MTTADIVIAGAGIIGLSAALEFAAAGLHVTVIERGRAMSESSWAAAGMLAVGDPENPPELRPLAHLSIELYPGFLRNIENLSGLRVPIRTVAALQASSRGRGFRGAVPLAREEVNARVPGLNTWERNFLWLEEQSLDPRDLCAALPQAARRAGVTLIEQTSVTAFHLDGPGVRVDTSTGAYRAAHFLNCCGAWSGAMCALPIGPRKGQMLALRLPDGARLDCVVRTPEFYLVPRGDGRVILGATVERAGFDKSVHEEALQDLIEQAAALWLPLTESKILDCWAGLRPGTNDGLPVIGAAGPDHCWIASGHFRNGILLAPATARVVRQLVLGETAEVDISLFECSRFLPAPVHS